MAIPTELNSRPILRIEHSEGNGWIAVTIWLSEDSGTQVVFKDGHVGATTVENPPPAGYFDTDYLDDYDGWHIQPEVDVAIAYLKAIGIEVPDFLPHGG